MGWPQAPWFQGGGTLDAWFIAPTAAGARVFASNGRTWFENLLRALREIIGDNGFGSPPIPRERQSEGGGLIRPSTSVDWHITDLPRDGMWNDVVSAALYYAVNLTNGEAGAGANRRSLDQDDDLRRSWHEQTITRFSVIAACWLIAGPNTVALQAIQVPTQAVIPQRGIRFEGPDDGAVVVFDPAVGPSSSSPATTTTAATRDNNLILIGAGALGLGLLLWSVT